MRMRTLTSYLVEYLILPSLYTLIRHILNIGARKSHHFFIFLLFNFFCKRLYKALKSITGDFIFLASRFLFKISEKVYWSHLKSFKGIRNILPLSEKCDFSDLLLKYLVPNRGGRCVECWLPQSDGLVNEDVRHPDHLGHVWVEDQEGFVGMSVAGR